MTDLPVPEGLPTLPNLTDLRDDAQKVVDYWTGVRDEAERRRAQAQEYLDSTSNSRNGSVISTDPGEDAVRRVLQCLADASGPRKSSGIAGTVGISSSYVNQCLRVLEQRGHARRERHHHGFRALITDAGMEWLTAPARPAPGDAHHPAVRS